MDFVTNLLNLAYRVEMQPEIDRGFRMLCIFEYVPDYGDHRNEKMFGMRPDQEGLPSSLCHKAISSSPDGILFCSQARRKRENRSLRVSAILA